MIVKKTPEQIDRMAAAGDILVRTLELVEGKIRPGVTTQELDEAAERFIRSQGAVPAFKGYRGFPGSICASPNAMVVHGIPGAYKLERGDVLSVDVGVVLDGWVADAARTFAVGPISSVAQKLLETTEGALFAAVLLLGSALAAGAAAATTSRTSRAGRSRATPSATVKSSKARARGAAHYATACRPCSCQGVSTRGPAAVIAIVNSKWAASDPSCVKIDQWSSAIRTWWRPAVTIGSIASTIPSSSRGPRPGGP